MKIAVASDHAGRRLKDSVRDHLRTLGHEVQDLGPDQDGRVDYPDFGARGARMVAAGQVDRAVLVCGSGIGMSMTANRFRGVRAVVAALETQARLARAHNDANVLCLGERLTAETLALVITEAFMDAEFEGGRHEARVAKIDDVGDSSG
ncbi:MAG: ribose 5-phosphate isomerase B [Myxococcota bacterium]